MNRTLCPFWLAFWLALPGYFMAQTDASLFPKTKISPCREMKTGPAADDYWWLEFREMPDKLMFGEMCEQGITLLDFQAPNRYLATIPAQPEVDLTTHFPIKTMRPFDTTDRLSAAFQQEDFPDWAISKNNLEVVLQFHKNLSHPDVLRRCEQDGIRVLASNGINHFLRASIPLENWQDIARLPYIAFMDLVPPPASPDDFHGRAMHRSNALMSGLPNGRHYDGEGVALLCRDDGMVGPHIDFAGRLDNSLVENPTAYGGKHGDGVCGIMAGSGNLHPRRMGMAPAATVFTLDYESSFLDETMSLHLDHNVLITNSSYSNGCNAGYTLAAATVDQQLHDHPALMHVFSAGNSNNLSCGYGAGDQWGNITGGHKQAKNCLTIANLNASGALVATSSRGPATDGRIKPDLAAFGEGHVSTDHENAYQVFGGTSAAAPGVAGVLAQLHHAHRLLHGGATADAALLKACLLNTANDLGTAGPDFRYGWGQVNALRAVQTLEENRFLKNEISPGEIIFHAFDIPEGVVEARLMVYWHDREGMTTAPKSLVNNLDIKLTGPDGLTHLPWFLDPSPNSLGAPAARGTDDLNNMEQVTVAFPKPGPYQLEVFGKTLPFGPVSYHFVWEWRREEIRLANPIGGESFSPGDTVSILWDATTNAGIFQIELSTDGGTTFAPLGTMPSPVGIFQWVVPNMATGRAKIRVSNQATGAEGVSEGNFSMAALPTNLRVERACPDFLNIAWDGVDFGPTTAPPSYEVFLLGNREMELVGTTTATHFELPTTGDDPTKAHWIALKAVGENGIRSERTVAVNYQYGLLNCPQMHDLSVVEINSPSEGTFFGCGSESSEVKAVIRNEGQMPASHFPLAYRINNGPAHVEVFSGTILPGTEATFSFTKKINLAGGSDVDLAVFTSLPSDVAHFNDTLKTNMQLALYQGFGEKLDFWETFEGANFPPPFSAIENPDQGITWTKRQVTGIQGTPTQALFINNYTYANVGQTDAFLVVPIDLTQAINPLLQFDLAYAPFSPAYSDGLRVELSTDCGQTFGLVVFEKQGAELATAENHNQLFLPDGPDEWRTESVYLEGHIGHSVVLRFVNVTGYGNSLFLDNIRVLERALPTAHFQASATEICMGTTVVFSDESTGQGMTRHWQFGPAATPTEYLGSGPVEVMYSTTGTFTAVLTVSNTAGASSFSRLVSVKEEPVPHFTVETNGNYAVFTNLSLYANTYLWEFGDGAVSQVHSPFHQYAEPGQYEVSLLATNVCGTYSSEPKAVVIVATGLEEKADQSTMKVFPNPATSFSFLEIGATHTVPIRFLVRDARGREFFAREIQSSPFSARYPLPIEILQAGVYFVEIETAGSRQVVKWVVVK